MSWPKAYFDKNNQRCLPRFVGDKADCEAANILIEDAKSRASRIVMRYYANEKVLDLEAFVKEFQGCGLYAKGQAKWHVEFS